MSETDKPACCDYDIVLLPADEVTQRAIDTSRQLQQFDAWFELSEFGPFAHASLYMVRLKCSDLDKAKDLLAEIAAKTPVQNLVATTYYQAEGYIDAEYARTNELATFQMTVISSLNPIRDDLRENDLTRLREGTITGLGRENTEKYGYRSVGELLRPHLTFTRFKTDSPIDTTILPAPQTFGGQFTKLGIFELGDHGTCARKVAEFKLQPGLCES